MNGVVAAAVPAHSGPIHRAIDTGSVSRLPQNRQAGFNVISGRDRSNATGITRISRSRIANISLCGSPLLKPTRYGRRVSILSG